MSVYIDQVKAREVFDSRGNPTVEVDVILSDVLWVEQKCHQGLLLVKKKLWN